MKKLLREIISMYKVILILFIPVLISITPLLMYVYFDNKLFLFFIIISFPIGAAVGSILSELDD